MVAGERYATHLPRFGCLQRLNFCCTTPTRSAAQAVAVTETTPQAPLGVYLDLLDYLKRLVGMDHVGIGPDFVDGQDLSKPEHGRVIASRHT